MGSLQEENHLESPTSAAPMADAGLPHISAPRVHKAYRFTCTPVCMVCTRV